jgi:hypothetical protein
MATAKIIYYLKRKKKRTPAPAAPALKSQSKIKKLETFGHRHRQSEKQRRSPYVNRLHAGSSAGVWCASGLY